MKSDNNKQTSYRGIGFSGLLTIVFIVLKLCGVISWAWGWVLAPIWISAGLWVLALIATVVAVIKDA